MVKAVVAKAMALANKLEKMVKASVSVSVRLALVEEKQVVPALLTASEHTTQASAPSNSNSEMFRSHH